MEDLRDRDDVDLGREDSPGAQAVAASNRGNEFERKPVDTNCSKLIITYLPVGTLRQNPHNSRTHTKRQIRQIANSIKAFGFNNPVLLDERNTIIAGRGRVSAAKLIGIAEVPTIRLGDLSSDQVRAYVRSRSEQEDLRGWPLLPYDVSFRGKLRTACRRTEKCVRDWGRPCDEQPERALKELHAIRVEQRCERGILKQRYCTPCGQNRQSLGRKQPGIWLGLARHVHRSFREQVSHRKTPVTLMCGL